MKVEKVDGESHSKKNITIKKMIKDILINTSCGPSLALDGLRWTGVF